MSSLASRINDISVAVQARELDPEAAVSELVLLTQARGGRAGRREDGAYFTDADVAAHLVRRALCGWLLDVAGEPDADVELALACGEDLHRMLAHACRDPKVFARVVDGLGRVMILDPSCGAGSFLVAAWQELRSLERLLQVDVVSVGQLLGVDIDPEAATAARVVLEIVTEEAVPEDAVTIGDAQAAGVLPPADIIVGNPPFVRARAAEQQTDLDTAGVPNRSAWIVERALAVARPGASVSFVLPVSTACTDAFAPARLTWAAACDRVLSSHFDTIPCSLFDGVVQRLTLLEGRVRRPDSSGAAQWWTTRYHRWVRSERAGLLDRVRFVPLPAHSVGGSLAKIGTAVEAELLQRLFAHPPAERLLAPRAASGNRLFYKRRWSYYLLFTDFEPPIWDADGNSRAPSELKSLDVDPRLDARALVAIYSSTLFWWYFSVFTDNRNLNRRDLEAFPIPPLQGQDARELESLGRELMVALRACGEVRTCTYRSVGTIHNTYFRQGETRPVLDRIDRELARLYGLSDAHLEFVLAFERRFRA